MSPRSSETLAGEVGHIQGLTHAPHTIVFRSHYHKPVVFAQPLSQTEADTAVVRISEVQTDRCTLLVHEVPGANGAHAAESVSYLVLDTGTWELADGALLEVGLLRTAATVGVRLSEGTWRYVRFRNPFAAPPVVISQAQTAHDPHWVKTRQHNTTALGFEVALEEEEVKTTSHGSETIGWLAITAGQGNWDAHAYQAERTEEIIRHTWQYIGFSQSFTQAPRLLAMLASYNDADNAHLRHDGASLTATGVNLRVEEDTTHNAETSHAAEAASYLALAQDGTLAAQWWEVIRRGAALAGQVSEALTNRPIGGARITLNTMSLQPLQLETQTLADGHYHFLDLAAGQYTLTVSLPAAGSRYGTVQRAITVAGDGSSATANIALPPTTIQGRITADKEGEPPVFMAQVRLGGSPEVAYSDTSGNYRLTGVEAGERLVSVSARGYRNDATTAQLGQAGAIQTLNFKLRPLGSQGSPPG